MTPLNIKFNAQAVITQEVILLDNELNSDDLVIGLESGQYFTTISHSSGEESFIVDVNGKQIAQIVYQSSEQAELFEFE